MPRKGLAIVLLASILSTSGCATLRKKEAFQEADYLLREKTVAAVDFGAKATVATVAVVTWGFLEGLLDTDEPFSEQYQ